MRFGNLWIPALFCLALGDPPNARGQTEPAAPATEPTAATPAAATVGPEDERPWEPPPPPPAEPASPAPQPPQPGWGGQPASPWTAGPPAAAGWNTESFSGAVLSLPEDQLLGYWPVVAELGAGYGLTAEGTLRIYNSAVTVEPSAFLGLLPLWGMFQGPTFAVPFGLPGSYDKTVRGEAVTIEHGLSLALVPGYRILHPFRRDMFWAAGIGIPFLVSEWQTSARRDYTFTPGLEINGEYAYKFLAGLGVFVRATYQVYFGTYTLSTFGGSVGLVLYWEWFDRFRPPTPPTDAQQDREVWS